MIGEASYDHEGGPADGTPPDPPMAGAHPPYVAGHVQGEQAQGEQAQGEGDGELEEIGAGPAEATERGDRQEPTPPHPVAAEPSPLEPTGDERVDVALARFDELTAAPVADHVEVFEDVQRRLQEVLASIDNEEPPEAAATSDQPSARPDPGSRGS
jgi:hypothetical protein